MARNYFTLDVFTDRILGGNPLAVVWDSEGLSTEAMQAIAGEFNLSETVFVLPAKDPNHRANIRIFTPRSELPFAGHPTVGSAVLIAMQDGIKEGECKSIILEEKVGPVPCRVECTDGRYEAEFDLPKIPIRSSIKVSENQFAEALGLNPDQIGLPGHECSLCDGGVPFPMVPVRDLAAMAQIEVDEHKLNQFSQGDFAAEVYVYCRETVNAQSDFHVRLFAPALGIAEDPATGSAAAAFAAQIMSFEKPGEGTHRYILEQGIEMGRPSSITLQIVVENGTLKSGTIGGSAMMFSQGKLAV